MNLKKISFHLNIFARCRKYRIPIYECPQFIFFIMGMVIIATSLITYSLGVRYIVNPDIVAIIVLLLAIVLFIISYIAYQSFEKLFEVNRMKSEFIGIVSHQLRAPLTNLSWGIETLISGEQSKCSKKQKEYLVILKENSLRMKNLISDLLTVSRIEIADIPFFRKKVFLPRIINKVILDFNPSIKASNINVEFRYDKPFPKISTDTSQISRVLSNLLDNTIRYISSVESIVSGKSKLKKVKIFLNKRKRDVYFEIKDNGMGIPKNDQKYIFQKFFRSSNVLKHQTQGSGLGLYIAKAIIEKAGGKIGFKSKEKKGTTFWFTLPKT
ncbi:MAG: HAMP domain-containing sensor histidine kinase [Patescibacteria group bacterium]|nr:HAMP domain-containing sensor histidine kinase [Patescibacteria group bacterium]